MKPPVILTTPKTKSRPNRYSVRIRIEVRPFHSTWKESDFKWRPHWIKKTSQIYKYRTNYICTHMTNILENLPFLGFTTQNKLVCIVRTYNSDTFLKLWPTKRKSYKRKEHLNEKGRITKGRIEVTYSTIPQHRNRDVSFKFGFTNLVGYKRIT